MNETDREIALHKELGCDYAAIGGVPQDYGHTPEGFRRWLGDAQPVIAKLKEAGLRFGHHQHSHEFLAGMGL